MAVDIAEGLLRHDMAAIVGPAHDLAIELPDQLFRLATQDQSDVGALSCRVTFKPVSGPLQPGVRFFRPPKLAPP